MDADTWRKEILFCCDHISIVDRDFARCRYIQRYPKPTHECSFEMCPKRQDRNLLKGGKDEVLCTPPRSARF